MMLGMITGVSPRTAYLARMSAMRASAGIAGNGSPFSSINPMSAVRSTPVTVSVD